uniref:Integrase, catalytic region, zinc finger, CCHC-type, peptidase aspartic, catalytic n=1 Tax=Tanacetum cinerariifolium TaxID=118510 RepID=A0A699HLW8_TANCI|nr:hypothetical protein [Tanacetum cinerariifolium]
MTEKLFAEYNGINVKQFRETLLLHMGNVKKFVAERTHHKRQYDRRMNEIQMQSRKSKVVSSKALEACLVVTECGGTKSNEHITSSNSGTYITHVVDADIKPGGEIDQDAERYQVKSPLLNAEFFKTKDMVEKEVYDELSNRFLQLEKHCISLEISIQKKEESFQSNKPCKNQDSPKFHRFFKINKLKAQLQAKNSTINNLKKQIKNVHEKINEAKVKHDIDVIETINIELEHKLAKLLKENESLKKHYKDLYDSIKVMRTKTIKQTTSLIAKNDECKAQLQEKVFTIAALKNELRKLKRNSVDTKFAKPSILDKPVLQPPRNQSVVRQPNAFKSERLNFSKPRISLNKSSTVHEKPNTLRSCLRWKPTGRIFKIAGLRWIPTGKMFTDCTTKVDSEPPNGSNDDITNPYECDQTLNASAGENSESIVMVKLTPGYISSGLVQNSVSLTPYVPPSKKDYEILFQSLFDEYFNPPPRTVSLDSAAVATPRAVDPAGSLSSTTIDQDVPSASTSPITQESQSQVTHQGNSVVEIYYLKGRIMVDYIKMEMQIPRSSRVKFIATCSYSRLNDLIIMKAQEMSQSFRYSDITRPS